MSQGGWGGNPGGGWGPPGGPPPSGGYGPPGPGYGVPPGPPQGPPPPTVRAGVGRLLKTAFIGGVIGGVLSIIPILEYANCCFCLLNMIGAGLGVVIYLKRHPGENITNGDALASGV